MTPNVQTKTQQPFSQREGTDTQKRLSLADLLARSMEEDAVTLEDPTDQERWDDDEGSFGG
jgi:hypothetical protein